MPLIKRTTLGINHPSGVHFVLEILSDSKPEKIAAIANLCVLYLDDQGFADMVIGKTIRIQESKPEDSVVTLQDYASNDLENNYGFAWVGESPMLLN